MLSEKERKENLKGVFQVQNEEKIKNKKGSFAKASVYAWTNKRAKTRQDKADARRNKVVYSARKF